MPFDISKYVEQLEKQLKIAQGVIPIHTWKGNWAPDTHHFDPGSIKFSFDAVPTAEKQFYIRFDYTDAGAAHSVEADLKVVADDHGVPTGATWSAKVDGADQGDCRVHTKVVEGLEFPDVYVRLVVEILLADGRDARFDGDIGS